MARFPFFNFVAAIAGITLCFTCALPAQERIVISANAPPVPFPRFMQGFLHGNPAQVDSALTARLKPAFWRVGAYALEGGSYEDARRFGPKITVNLNDLYMIVNNIPSQNQSKPWLDHWEKWDMLVATVAQNALQTNSPVEYWDAFGEPDNFWSGTYAQWIEMYRRTDSILTAILPQPNLIGPEFGFADCNFQVEPILDFLDHLHAVGATLDGVSWHEFCHPENTPDHVRQLRDSLALRPWASALDILIPEYAGPAHCNIPGWSAGWLFYLEQANVDWVSRACWDEFDGLQHWTNCRHGLNGLFMSDNATPQANYWVHRAYAELGANRVFTQPQQPATIAMADKNDSLQTMKIIVGRFLNPNLGLHDPPADVDISIRNYPYGQNTTIPMIWQRIPSADAPFSTPLTQPQTAFSGHLTFMSDSAHIVIPNFVDGDVYIVYLNPSDQTLLSGIDEAAHPGIRKRVEINPNPAYDGWFVQSDIGPWRQLTLYHATGEIIWQMTTPAEEAYIPAGALHSGLYYLRIDLPGETLVKSIMISR